MYLKMRNEDKLISDILHILNENNSVISGSIVGSVKDKSFEEISDIDIVAITNKISFEIIDSIKTSLLSLKPSDYDLDLNFKVNDTFGPLKFDNPKELYFHLMVYDLKGHIQHVVQSPFTCFDWDRTDLVSKVSLPDIFSAKRLMLNDFLSSRRGIYDYISDLTNKQISFRSYKENEKGEIFQEKQYLDIDSKHMIEYCFHILKNSITNLIKFIENRNERYEEDQFLQKWKSNFPVLYDKYSKLFLEISSKKKLKDFNSSISEKSIVNFLDDFYSEVKNYYDKSEKIILVRHFETELNDGRLYGQNNEGSIQVSSELPESILKMNLESYEYFVSPLNRALQTYKVFNLENDPKIDKKLLEINYGKAEGLFFQEFIEKYPEFKSSIEREDDFRYPEGENYEDMHKRINELMKSLDKDTFLITHQGPIRVLLGKLFNLKYGEMYKLQIPHGQPIEVIKIENTLYPNLSREVYFEIFKNFSFNNE